MSPSAITRTKAAAVVGGGALLVLGLAVHSVAFSSSPVHDLAAPLRPGAPVATIADVGAAAEVLEQECDCAPLWECMQKEQGSCGLLEKQLRDCVARSKRT